MAKENNKNWVNYKEIKEKISMQMVLEHYGIELKKSGQNLAGCCPIHQGTNRRQFSVSPERNIWNCFGNCKEGGNVLDFVAMMEFGNKEPQSIRKAARQLKNWFLTGSTEPGGNKRVSGRLASGKGGQAGQAKKKKGRTTPKGGQAKSESLGDARDRQKAAGVVRLSVYIYTDLLGVLKKILTLNLHIIVSDDAASLLANWFRSEGKIHLSKWQPEVWDHEKFLARRVSRWLMELSNGLMNAKATAS